jgi:uncharacterized protein YuzE
MMIFLADHPGVEAEEVAENVILSFDKENNVVAIEILNGTRELFGELVEWARKAKAR